MGFGFCNVLGIFLRVMNLVLWGLYWNSVLVFLDDIFVLGKDFYEYLSNIKEVLERFRFMDWNLSLKSVCYLNRK